VLGLGGMAQKQQLVRRGARDLDLTRAVRSGEVIRVRNGWYSTLSEQDPALRAVRVGGRLTGLSALHAMGAWMLDMPPLHVAVPMNAARLRRQNNRHARLNPKSPRGVVLHWESPDVASRGTAVSVGLVDALRRVILDESFETAIAALDWALGSGALDRIDLETLRSSLPAERSGVINWADGECDSLPESLSRTRCSLEGYQVESQVLLPDGRPIDLVIEGCIGYEVDGEQFHVFRFAADRDKDVAITLDGKHSFRPTANMVFHEWERIAAAIRIILVDRGVVSENSGSLSHSRRRAPGIAGFWRRPLRRSPEFPKPHTARTRIGGGGNSARRARG
jgi:hypothetical protein